jgi:hypothetical protein
MRRNPTAQTACSFPLPIHPHLRHHLGVKRLGSFQIGEFYRPVRAENCDSLFRIPDFPRLPRLQVVRFKHEAAMDFSDIPTARPARGTRVGWAVRVALLALGLAAFVAANSAADLGRNVYSDRMGERFNNRATLPSVAVPAPSGLKTWTRQTLWVALVSIILAAILAPCD